LNSQIARVVHLVEHLQSTAGSDAQVAQVRTWKSRAQGLSDAVALAAHATRGRLQRQAASLESIRVQVNALVAEIFEDSTEWGTAYAGAARSPQPVRRYEC
jgi:hypothetical protein